MSTGPPESGGGAEPGAAPGDPHLAAPRAETAGTPGPAVSTSESAGRRAFVTAVSPLVAAMGGELIPPAEAGRDDVLLEWEGAPVTAVRLPHLSHSLEHLLDGLRRRHGMPLAELDRKAKQEVVVALEARGAFTVRHGVETVATALGVSRFTVYNYLNREAAARADRSDGPADEGPGPRAVP